MHPREQARGTLRAGNKKSQRRYEQPRWKMGTVTLSGKEDKTTTGTSRVSGVAGNKWAVAGAKARDSLWCPGSERAGVKGS